MKHILNTYIYSNVQHKDNWDVRLHLLSLLWSSSPSRQMIRHNNKTVIRIPAAWLRLEEAGAKSSPSVVCLSTVLQRKVFYFYLLELNLRHLMIRFKKKRALLTSDHTQLLCATRTDTDTRPSPAGTLGYRRLLRVRNGT